MIKDALCALEPVANDQSKYKRSKILFCTIFLQNTISVHWLVLILFAFSVVISYLI